ncbi:hypothetical protein LJR267_009874 [Paraburkholderia hospita]|jgi:hypothetical protein|uniref:hypothetical protein n=1 Tax=Paraburkholderia hospita TaxID=169430 RepID=UPI003ED0D5D0
MNSEDIEKQHAGLVALAIVSLIAGAACGALGTLFRLSLERADQARDVFIARARSEPVSLDANRSNGYPVTPDSVAPNRRDARYP